MKKLFLIISIVIIAGSVFVGCEKEDISSKSYLGKYEIREFENLEQLFKEIDYVNSLDYDQLVEYEKSLNFNSFGKIANELLDNLSEDTTIIFDHLQKIINENSNFLMINPIEDEYNLDIKYCSTPFLYIMNSDRMFIVDNYIYKVFDTCLVKSFIENYDKLLQLKDKDIQNLGESFSVIPQPKISSNNATTVDFIQKEKINGKEKVIASLRCVVLDKDTANGQTFKYSSIILDIRGYRKFANIWWPVKRHLSNNLASTISSYGYPVNYSSNCGSNTGCTWGRNRTVTICRKADIVPSDANLSYYIKDALGYAKIPAAKIDFDYVQ